MTPSEAATAKQIATFLARTPTALVEIRRKVAEEEDGAVEVVGHHTFVVPAYGDFLYAACDRLEDVGYTNEPSSLVGFPLEVAQDSGYSQMFRT